MGSAQPMLSVTWRFSWDLHGLCCLLQGGFDEIYTAYVVCYREPLMRSAHPMLSVTGSL